MAVFSSIAAIGAVAGAAVGAYSSYQSYKEQKKAASAQQQMASAQKESIAAQQRGANVQAARERMQMAREARIRRSQVLATAGLTGMGAAGTAGVTGAVSSIGAQLGANIGTANVLTGFAEIASQANQQAADFASKASGHMAKAQQWQTIGSIGSSIFSQAGGYTTIFGGNTSKSIK